MRTDSAPLRQQLQVAHATVQIKEAIQKVGIVELPHTEVQTDRQDSKISADVNNQSLLVKTKPIKAHIETDSA
jgi:hypothetical protein